MIVVTGGAGFIGSNLVLALNERGRSDVVVVEDLRDGHKVRNLVDCEIEDLVDRDAFLEGLTWEPDRAREIEVIFHQGACADTMEWDGRLMMEANYEYSKALFHVCRDHGVPFIYASSAAVYGASTVFAEERRNERPLNLYGYSKFLFDQYVRRHTEAAASQVAGLRYFNVYGPREQHKGEMASVAFKKHRELLASGRVSLFEGSAGYEAGEQRRDFVWVGDAVDVNLWLWDHPDVSGIFNVGTGRSQTFNEVARAVIAYHGRGEIDYVPFPATLLGSYQSFTEADITALRKAGYDAPFATVEEAIPRYLAWLERQVLAG